MKCWICKK